MHSLASISVKSCLFPQSRRVASYSEAISDYRSQRSSTECGKYLHARLMSHISAEKSRIQLLLYLRIYVPNIVLTLLVSFLCFLARSLVANMAGHSSALTMVQTMLPPAPFAVGIVAILCVLFLAYQWALPKPIAGIPYNASATKSLFGDIPSIVSYMSKTGRLWPWIMQQNINHQSPIVQVFARLFAAPWVLISDYRESQDILLRRTQEFDRSTFVIDAMVGLVPDFRITMHSTDPRFKTCRNLLKDLMTPGFLNEVEAPQIHANVETLVKLWDLKTQLAQGHPFHAAPDIYNVTLDSVFAATFGLEAKNSATTSQLEHLLSYTSTNEVRLPQTADMPVDIPRTHRPATFEAITTLTESMEISIKAPLPRLAHWCLRQLPYMREARAIKERLIHDEVEKGVRRLSSGDHIRRSALDDILHREVAISEKEGKQPAYHSRVIYDELFGFIVGGHDTTSTTLSWALKHLAVNQNAQSTLRSHLRNAYEAAAKEHRNPTAHEITSVRIPYLDATIEEVVRTACIFPGVVRIATVDTTVLGHVIPKGTNLFLLQMGPGYFLPPFPIADSQRHESSLKAQYQVGAWTPDADDMKKFRPERWLVTDADGNEAFDSQAGPHLAFGLGPRGCFGRRLGYLQMRIILVLMIWNFELLPLPAELNLFDAIDTLATSPKQCYVRLAKAKF
ncbi:cytochrome P450 [Exophiala viscosa]|uniref:cytochrome P450 n=1 Tax=Exophiala viscosa TaxID=2486360 RepID=UPI00219E9782|nr:cytochrome P450 [Exophiala viscosa]